MQEAAVGYEFDFGELFFEPANYEYEHYVNPDIHRDLDTEDTDYEPADNIHDLTPPAEIFYSSEEPQYVLEDDYDFFQNEELFDFGRSLMFDDISGTEAGLEIN